MQDTQEMVFVCPKCQSEHRWRPEAAGRPVVCSCKTELITPFLPGAAQVQSNGVLWDETRVVRHVNDTPGAPLPTLKPLPTSAAPANLPLPGGLELAPPSLPKSAETCPRCGTLSPAGSAACTDCGYVRKKKKKKRLLKGEKGATPLAPDAPRTDPADAVPGEAPVANTAARRRLTWRRWQGFHSWEDSALWQQHRTWQAKRLQSRGLLGTSDLNAHALPRWRSMALPIVLGVLGLCLQVSVMMPAHIEANEQIVQMLTPAPLLLSLAVTSVALMFMLDVFFFPVLSVSITSVETQLPALLAATLLPIGLGIAGHELIASHLSPEDNPVTVLVAGWLIFASSMAIVIWLCCDPYWPHGLLLIATLTLCQMAVYAGVLAPLSDQSALFADLWRWNASMVINAGLVFILATMILAPYMHDV